MLPDNPFDLAQRSALRIGVCPVELLDDFFTNHTTFDELCSYFTCKTCVAMLGDDGICSSDISVRSPVNLLDQGDDQYIPF